MSSASPVFTGVHQSEGASSWSLVLLMRHYLCVWYNSCAWEPAQVGFSKFSAWANFRFSFTEKLLKPPPGWSGELLTSLQPVWEEECDAACSLSAGVFLDEPLNFSSSQVPSFAEKEWWCFCITEKLFWVVINDRHVWVFREEISLELLLCEIIVFRMACEKFLQIYFIFSWYPSSSLYLCPKCNYKMFP